MARPLSGKTDGPVRRCACGNRLTAGKTYCTTCIKLVKAARDAKNNATESLGVESDFIDLSENHRWVFEQLAGIVESRSQDSDIVSWSERVITLPPGDGWRGNQRLDFSKYPLAALILRLWKNPNLERMTLLMGTQTGKSTIELVIIADAMERSGANLIYVAPTDSLREKLPRTKLIPFLTASTDLGFYKAEQQNTILRWKNGRYVWGALATSANTLADTSGIGTAVMTEFDEILPNLKHDPFALTYDRIRFHHRRKMLCAGTPRRLDSAGLYSMYSESRMHVAEFPCPECGDYFCVEDNDLKWPENASADEIKTGRLAYVVCKSCGCEIGDQHHMTMAMGARLRCLNPDKSEIHCGIRVPSWFSAKMTFSESVYELLNAKSDLTKLAEWYKSVAAKPVDTYKLNAVDDTFRYEHRQSVAWHRERMEIPPDVIAVTAGIDVGTKGFWFVLLGWGIGGRKYVLWNADYQPKGMDTKAWDEAWARVLERCDTSKFNWLGNGSPPPFKLGIIDSGFDAPNVYSLCLKPTTKRWLPAKGDGGAHALYKKTNADPERKHGQKFAGLPLILHNTHFLQDILEKSLHTSIEDEQGIAFPADEHSRMFRHLEAAAKKELPNGSSRWDKTSKNAADHLRDALCLAVLAGEIMGLNKVSEPKKQVAPAEKRRISNNLSTSRSDRC